MMVVFYAPKNFYLFRFSKENKIFENWIFLSVFCVLARTTYNKDGNNGDNDDNVDDDDNNVDDNDSNDT